MPPFSGNGSNPMWVTLTDDWSLPFELSDIKDNIVWPSVTAISFCGHVYVDIISNICGGIFVYLPTTLLAVIVGFISFMEYILGYQRRFNIVVLAICLMLKRWGFLRCFNDKFFFWDVFFCDDYCMYNGVIFW